MKEMNESELKDVLEKHREWLENPKEGQRADLSYTELSHADMSCTDMSYANMRCTDLSHADMSHANMSCTDMSYANLSHANMSYTDLSHADMSYARLRGANLSYTDLSGTELSGADLRGTDLRVIHGLKHVIISYPGDDLQIGRERMTLTEWLMRYVEIGKKQKYTDSEIDEYGIYLKMLKELKAKQGGRK